MLENYNLTKQKHEKTSIPSLVGMGHHALAWESTSQWMGSYGSMEEWKRGRVNGLRGKWSQGTHMSSITIGSEGVS